VETRDRIFEAAVRLFSERKFEEVTVEMITESADVGKGTFFNYFASKESVIAHYFEVIANIFAQSVPRQIEQLHHIQAAPPTQRDLLQAEEQFWLQIMAIIHQLAEFDSKSRRFARTLLALSQTNEVVRKESLLIKQHLLEAAQEMIRLEQEIGLIRADFPPDIIARFLRNVYFSTVTEWAQKEESDTQSLVEILDINYRIARDAVRAPALRNS
jgi:AcrR family transcriptional regulator